MSKLRKEIQIYGNEVTSLLEDWNMDYYVQDFDSGTVADIVIHHIKDSYCYDESIHRCAIRVIAIVLDAHKQIKQIKAQTAFLNKPSMSSRIN